MLNANSFAADHVLGLSTTIQPTSLSSSLSLLVVAPPLCASETLGGWLSDNIMGTSGAGRWGTRLCWIWYRSWALAIWGRFLLSVMICSEPGGSCLVMASFFVSVSSIDSGIGGAFLVGEGGCNFASSSRFAACVALSISTLLRKTERKISIRSLVNLATRDRGLLCMASISNWQFHICFGKPYATVLVSSPNWSLTSLPAVYSLSQRDLQCP